MDERVRYWFPAKRYGWGWGPPCSWQGWIAVAIWLLVLAAGLQLLHARGPIAMAVFGALMSAGLVVLCWLTGEPPRWRWGDRP